MKQRRLRPSFLLQCVTLGSCAAVVVAVFVFAGIGVVTGATVIAALCLWFIGIEGGLLPSLLEYILTRRAEDSSKPVSSIWFVDVDEQRRAEWDAHSDGTSNNPTIR